MTVYKDRVHIGEIRGSHKAMQIYADGLLIAKITRTFKLGLFQKSLVEITSGPSFVLADGTHYEKLFPETDFLTDIEL